MNTDLRDTNVASCTDDRYQVMVHVDSKVLPQEVNDNEESPSTNDSQLTTSILPETSNEPWSWCGDSMDYDVALYNIACYDRQADADQPPI